MKSSLSIFCVFIIVGILDYGVLGAAGPPSPPGDLTKNSDTSYDPYLISSLRTKREDLKNVAGGDVRRSARQQRELYDPFYYYAPGIIRNRRNSHTYYAPYASYDRRRDVEYLYERNTQLDDASNNIFPDQPPPPRSVQTPVYQAYRNPNQFLTKQQIFGSQTRDNVVLARYYSPNAIDYRKPGYNNDNRFYGAADRDRPAYNNNYGRDQPGSSNEAWSVQVGTQLKVNDDGREKNPEQYYVRDEGRRGHSNQRRYSPYYRK